MVIRDLTLSDDRFIFNLLNSPTWLEHIGDRGIHALEDAAKYIQTQQDMYAAGILGLRAFQNTDEQPLGLVGLLQRDYLDAPDIGFAILPDHENKGFVTEASIAVIGTGSKQHGLDRLHGITSPGNPGSQRVLTKLGFDFIKVITPTSEDDPLHLFTLEITA